VTDRESKKINRRSGKRYTLEKTRQVNKLRRKVLPTSTHYLLCATATPGGQSFQSRQQLLPKRQQLNKKLYFDEFT